MHEAAKRCSAIPAQNDHSSLCMKSSMLTTPEIAPSQNVPRRDSRLTSQGTARLIPTPKMPSTKKKILTSCAEPNRSSAMSGTTVTMMDRYSGSRVKRTKNADVEGRLMRLAPCLAFEKYFNLIWKNNMFQGIWIFRSMDKNAYFFNASLFLRLGLKFIGNLERDILTVRMFYSRAEIKIFNWD